MTRTTGLFVAGLALAAAAVGVACRPGSGAPEFPPTAPTPTPPTGKDAPMPPRDQFGQDRDPRPAAKLPAVDGERAVGYVKDICDLGPRVSGTPTHTKLQKLFTDHFEKCGATVTRQDFPARQRSQRQPVAMTNLIASFHPDRPRRVILCAHYDTRPAAHEEPNRANWNKPFPSANDGTSGAGLLMELARHLKDLPTTVGVDIVLFDGEEYIFDMGVPGIREGDKYFFGSEHFAAEYAKNRPKLPYRYEAGVLLDLFAHENARLAVEGYSLQFAPRLVDELWRTAAACGAKSFHYERGFRRAMDVLDDHVALNAVAGIPTVDVIDFDYPHWHRLTDTPDKCSAKQMAEVGGVLLAWLAGAK
ncbi:MAG: M28 family peptidase [Fimbriiglobus sp.]